MSSRRGCHLRAPDRSSPESDLLRDMKTYQRSCHCGRIRFEVDLDLDHVRSCDCSICRKRGALIHRVEAARFRLLSPIQDLTLYQWHTRPAERQRESPANLFRAFTTVGLAAMRRSRV